MGLKSWFANRWLRKELKKIKEGDLSMLSGLLAKLLKDVGEGKYGEGPKKFYWGMAGKKTWTGVGIVALYGLGQVAVNALGTCVPECGSPEALAQLENVLGYFPPAVAVLVTVGLVDAGVRIDPPKK